MRVTLDETVIPSTRRQWNAFFYRVTDATKEGISP
jgi:hypothetical protein